MVSVCSVAISPQKPAFSSIHFERRRENANCNKYTIQVIGDDVGWVGIERNRLNNDDPRSAVISKDLREQRESSRYRREPDFLKNALKDLIKKLDPKDALREKVIPGDWDSGNAKLPKWFSPPAYFRRYQSQYLAMLNSPKTQVTEYDYPSCVILEYYDGQSTDERQAKAFQKLTQLMSTSTRRLLSK